MKYRFSKTSLERLNQCHIDLQRLFDLVIKRTPVDFGIACGYRSVSEQQELYSQGRTKEGQIVTHVDGINKKSKHNYSPSMAVDIYCFVNGSATWDKEHLILVAGVVLSCANELNIDIRWGGNWDGDGEIISDQNFQDLPHFELK